MAVKALGPDDIRKWLPLATLAVLILLVGIAQPSFLQPGTLIELASDTAVLFILATGVTFVIMLGGIDLSIQSMASLASVIVALTITRLGYGSFLLAIVIGAIAGLLSGIVHVRLKIPSFIATLAMGGVLFSAALVISKERSITLDEFGARLSSVDHRPVVWLAERYFYRASRSGRSACRSGAHTVRPLQRSDWCGRACGLRFRREGWPAKDLRLCAFGGVRGARGSRSRWAARKRFPHIGRGAPVAVDSGGRRWRDRDNWRRRQHMAHTGWSTDHFRRAHRDDVPRREHLRPKHRVRRSSDRRSGHHNRPDQNPDREVTLGDCTRERLQMGL